MISSKDSFLVKLNADRSYGWGLTWGISDLSYSEGLGSEIGLSQDGTIYLLGNFTDTQDLDPGPGTDLHYCSGYQKVYLTALEPNGTFKWCRSFGGSQWNKGNSVSVDPEGNIFISGVVGGYPVDMDPGPGIDETEHFYPFGWAWAYLSKFPPDGTW